jgi:hypothetical protein
VAFLEIVSPLLTSHPLVNHPVVGSWLLASLNPSKRWEILRAILLFALLLVALAAIVGLTRATMVLLRRYEARRTRQIQAVLSRLGFTLQEEREGLYLRFVGLFKIGQRGHSRQISNHFESALHADGITQLMDYSFEEGSGKGRRAFRHTLAVISDKRMELPAFVLAPQKIFSRIAQRFGAHDIDFDGFPRFNGTFKLQGDDEAAVRSLFTPVVIEELERHPDITLEGRAGNLLIFRYKKRVKPENFPRFHEEAQQLAQLFSPESSYRE